MFKHSKYLQKKHLKNGASALRCCLNTTTHMAQERHKKYIDIFVTNFIVYFGFLEYLLHTFHWRFPAIERKTTLTIEVFNKLFQQQIELEKIEISTKNIQINRKSFLLFCLISHIFENKHTTYNIMYMLFNVAHYASLT